MFQHLIDKGGAANVILETVRVKQKEYFRRQEDFPFTIIPETSEFSYTFLSIWQYVRIFLYSYRYGMFPMGLVFQRFDPRVDYLDYIIRYFGDTGLIDYYFYKYLPVKNMKAHKDYVEEPLILAHFSLSAIVWALLLLLSVSVFAKEYFNRQKKVASPPVRAHAIHVQPVR